MSACDARVVDKVRSRRSGILSSRSNLCSTDGVLDHSGGRTALAPDAEHEPDGRRTKNFSDGQGAIERGRKREGRAARGRRQSHG